MSRQNISRYLTLLFSCIFLTLPAAPLVSYATVEASPRSKEIIEAIQQPRIEPRRIIQQAQQDWDKYKITGNPENLSDSILRITTLLQRWDKDRSLVINQNDDPHAGYSAFEIMLDDFFVWERLLSWFHSVNQSNAVTEELRSKVASFVETTIRPMERGPNNRSFHFALAAIRAAELFPNAKNAELLKSYAEAVWDDWYRLGDTYEPGYVAHHFPQIIELGVVLGKIDELRSGRAKAAWNRFANHVAPSGRVIQPGDGGERDQEAYERGLILAAKVTGDPGLAWVALRNHRLSNRGKRTLSEVEKIRDELIEHGVEIQKPDIFSGVQYLFKKTHPVADRIILNASRDIGSPYMALYLNDRTNVTFHGHEDNRGEIFHYEANDALLLRREGWSKWPGHANTLVVVDAKDEFPHYLTRGLTPDHWYTARSNLSILRDYVESPRWQHAPEPTFQGMHAFRQRDNPDLGYAWTNPDALEGLIESVKLDYVIIRWANFSERPHEVFDSHYLTDLDFTPGMAWYREYRSVAPSAKTFEVTIRNLRISGMDNTRVLWSMCSLPESLELHYYPAGAGRDAKPAVMRGDALKDWIKLLDYNQIHLRCPPGRIDLVIPVESDLIHFSKDQWIELDYKLDKEARSWLRPPLRILVNGLNPRSMYPDRQQGGSLNEAVTQMRTNDLYSRSHYESIWTAQSEWLRHAVLTGEGVLIVLDEFRPGEDAVGLAGGPVWHLADTPTQGMHWFSAPSFSSKEHHLMVYFHPQRGNEYGTRFLPKLWRTHHGHGVFARRIFTAGKPAFFLSVFVPHMASTPAEQVSGRLHFHGGLDSARDSELGIRTQLSDDGNSEVIISGNDPLLHGKKITIKIDPNGNWSVSRQ